MSYEVTSPYGQLPVAYWQCKGFNCYEGSHVTDRAPGNPGDDIRDQATAHLRETGHPVLFFRGTSEQLEPLATSAKAGTQ